MHRILLRLGVLAAFAVCAFALPMTSAAADQGKAGPTLSFFSSGGGAHAGWLHTDDQPPGDTDQQAIRIHDTLTGYAGVLVHHVYGIPTAAYPNSSFDFKSNLASPSSLGYPRLEILFSDASGISSFMLSVTAFNDDRPATYRAAPTVSRT